MGHLTGFDEADHVRGQNGRQGGSVRVLRPRGPIAYAMKAIVLAAREEAYRKYGSR